MASIDIIELRKTDTGERFYPLTHVDAVVGLSDRDFFEKYTDDNGQTYSIRLKQEYTGLWTEGFVSAGGLNANAGGGGGGGVENLWALSDVYHSTAVLRAGGTQSVQPGDILSYGAGTNNQQWYARPVDTTPTLNSTGLITSGAVYSAVSAINALIPSAATSSNQLADKAFVNSSIASSTGSFDGTYNLVSDLNLSTSATHSQTATALASAISSPSNNDYCFVQVPTSDSTPTVISSTDRYKYNGSSWAYEYSINNSSFTQAQWDAINSGVTTTKVGNYDTHIADSTIHVTAADKAAWDAKQDVISDLSTIRSGAALGATALQSYTETDPVFSASAAAGITATNISAWNAKQNALTADQDYLTPGTAASTYQTKLVAGTDYVVPATLSGYVPTSRKINGADLTENRTLYVGTMPLQTTSGTMNLTGIGSINATGALTLSTTKKIYFGDSRYYLELVNIAESGDPEWAFHFSHGVYSDGFMSGGGLNANAGSGGGGSIDAYTRAETDAAIAAANFFVVNEYDTGYYEAKLKSSILDGADTRALDGISAPKVATEEIDDPNAQLRIMDGDGYVVAKVSSDGVQATSVEGKKVVTPRYRTDDENGFEILEDSFPGIVIADENGYVLERIRAGHGFYGSVKDKIIKQRNKPALSWIDDDFAILDNGSLLTVYSKLHTWCNSNGIYLDFASGIQTEDALTYMLNWEKEGFRYLLHPDHDGWWTGAGGYVHDITKVRSSLVETIRFFKSTGLCSSAKILVWPGSSNSVSDNLPVVQKYCECAISVLQGGNPAAINDRYQIRRIKIDEISSTKTKAYYKNWISQCLLNNEWVILYTHLYDVSSADTVDNTSNTFGNVMDIVSYANSLSRLRSTEEIWEERKLMYDF